ncbi:pyrroline-5-carboxylate reductase [Aurantimicrobium minutum]|uniref:pyrroline-5-carboxylate reductase n=1 Tax=Aurantimicrobium minutum TaxID=708131 RepID=UPI0024751132|nr:pyrroline-5-carboxylate reductase [Aurantimicrobium minutum]
MLGAGSMARAILAGLLAPHVHVDGAIRVTNRNAENAARFDDEPRVTAWATATSPEANLQAVRGASIVLVAVKPAMVPDLLDEISPALSDGTIVVSVAAGVTTATMEAHLPAHVSVIRTMPNTPAKVGLAVTGIAAGSRSTAAQLDLICALFGTVGEVIVLPEDKIDALGSVSGSGPAYVFYMIEKLTAVAREHGFSAEEAARMVQGTFRGAVELLEQSGEDPQELRRQVTSPKGSTERAIAVFDDADIQGILLRGTQAAIARSEEMARGE